VLVLERAYVRRDEYYAAGWDGINGWADFMNQDCEPDRWDALDVRLHPAEHRAEGPVLLVGQVPWDASVQHTDHLAWLADTVSAIRRYTDRPVRLRPHPLARAYTPLVFGTEMSEGTLEEDLAEAVAVVTFNSNVGVDAMVAGVPTFFADAGSMVRDVAERNLALLGNRTLPPLSPGRPQWAWDLAYAQWTRDEMREGLAWRHLRLGLDMVQGPLG
jgi:hypothetical protein